jgi:hypothetical protein
VSFHSRSWLRFAHSFYERTYLLVLINFVLKSMKQLT